MKNSFLVLLTAMLAVSAVYASEKRTEPVPQTIQSAHTVYLTSPSGDEFGMFPMPEDRDALIAMRRVITSAHRLKLVFDPGRADLIVVVSSRASKDTIKVFDSHARKKCLWQLSGRYGLQGQDEPNNQ